MSAHAQGTSSRLSCWLQGCLRSCLTNPCHQIQKPQDSTSDLLNPQPKVGPTKIRTRSQEKRYPSLGIIAQVNFYRFVCSFLHWDFLLSYQRSWVNYSLIHHRYYCRYWETFTRIFSFYSFSTESRILALSLHANIAFRNFAPHL